ncbi:MAG: HDOD domain-containing protein [Planctomycetaceae bacterium]|nr:HDOD domain-containing protein [Planctomycetaceae bacterium]
MRTLPLRHTPGFDLRRPLGRLDSLPLRPTTARMVLSAATDAPSDPTTDRIDASKWLAPTGIDPGWVLATSCRSRPCDPLALVSERPWWPVTSAAASEALHRLWRHAVAAGLAAWRLAREVNDPEPERVADAALLHGLGRWAAAAIDPDWLAAWLAEADPRGRREFERRTLGAETTVLGRTLAERWGCDPLVAEAAWLHDDPDGGLNGCAAEPARLAVIQQAYAHAERTPWALSRGAGRAPSGADPRIRLLTAEVQVRCSAAFVEPDATPHEERLSRAHARLYLESAELRTACAARDRFLGALAGSEPTEDPETWAERAGLAWCGMPGMATARVVWTGPGTTSSPRDVPLSHGGRPATLVVPLVDRGRPCAEVHLWIDPDRPTASSEALATRDAWQAWAALVAERARTATRLDQAVRAHRDRIEREQSRLLVSKLDALAEFAAGAGHELNNPLAVIVGRAQLLLARESDPAASRMLRAILAQAQRAHRILRDLMYVARPSEPRPRFCQPEEILRACLRDAKAEADARGVQIVAGQAEPGPKVWADPDALRHLAEVLLRNALEATPKGGTIRVSSSGDGAALRWTVQDTGRGITPAEGQRLFDPFYCGRQAGRGLGLGLPRAARFVSLAGGDLRWHSTPGQGTTFHLHLPLAAPPKPPVLAESETGPPGSSKDPSLPTS